MNGGETNIRYLRVIHVGRLHILGMRARFSEVILFQRFDMSCLIGLLFL